MSFYNRFLHDLPNPINANFEVCGENKALEKNSFKNVTVKIANSFVLSKPENILWLTKSFFRLFFF